MGWRVIRRDDIRLGLVVRFPGMEDTPYNGGTVIADSADSFKVARPMAYAHQFSSGHPLLSCEVQNFHHDTKVLEVYESPRGRLHTMGG